VKEQLAVGSRQWAKAKSKSKVKGQKSKVETHEKESLLSSVIVISPRALHLDLWLLTFDFELSTLDSFLLTFNF
jgi:hypothetical protein